MKNDIYKFLTGILIFAGGGILNYFGSNPRILYFPAIALWLWIGWVIFSGIHTYISKEEGRLSPQKLEQPSPTFDMSKSLTSPFTSLPQQNVTIRTTNQQGNNTGIVNNFTPPVRLISDEQSLKFIKLLEGAPKAPIGIVCKIHDNETDNYIHKIRSLLDNAGYGTTQAKNIITFFTGMQVDINIDATIALVFSDRQGPPNYAYAMRSAFESIGIRLAIIRADNAEKLIKPGEAVMYVSERK